MGLLKLAFPQANKPGIVQTCVEAHNRSTLCFASDCTVSFLPYHVNSLLSVQYCADFFLLARV